MKYSLGCIQPNTFLFFNIKPNDLENLKWAYNFRKVTIQNSGELRNNCVLHHLFVPEQRNAGLHLVLNMIIKLEFQQEFKKLREIGTL